MCAILSSDVFNHISFLGNDTSEYVWQNDSQKCKEDFVAEFSTVSIVLGLGYPFCKSSWTVVA